MGRETEYEYNSSYANAEWLITKVIYPTGGYTEYSYIDQGSGSGGGGSLEVQSDVNNSNNETPSFLTGETSMIGENATDNLLLDSASEKTDSSDIAYYDRPYKFFGKLTADKEVISKRTETSKTFDNGDGTYTSVFHAKPIHFKNELNSLEEIDARISRENGMYKIYKNNKNVIIGNNSLFSMKDQNIINFALIPIMLKLDQEEIKIDMNAINWKYLDEYHIEGEIIPDVNLWIQSNETFFRNAIKTNKAISDFEVIYEIDCPTYSVVNDYNFSNGKKFYKKDQNDKFSFTDINNNSIEITSPIMWNDENSSSSISHELWEENGHIYYRKYASKDGKDWLLNQRPILYLDATTTYYGDTEDGYLDYQHQLVYEGSEHYGPYYGSKTSLTTNVGYYYESLGYGFVEHIYRSYLYFDTSSLPRRAIITDANLSLYGYKTSSSDGIVHMYTGTQATPFTVFDWASFTGNSYGYATYTTSNSLKSWSVTIQDISLTSYTKFCARSNNENFGQGNSKIVYLYSADYSGTSYDPKLIITYNVYNILSQKVYESQDILSSENAFVYTVSDEMVTQVVTTTKDGQGSTKNTTTLVFAEDGTTTSKTVKDANATQLYKIEYAYNSNLETTQESVYRGNTASVTYTKKYNYDNWGNLVYYEDPMVNRYYYSFINTNYEYSFRDFAGSTVSGFSNSFYTENPTVSDDIHTLLCGKAFNNNGTNIESYYKYDSKGNLTYSKNKHDNDFIETSNVYDSWGNITSATDPLSHAINFEYDDDYNHAYLTRTHASVGGVTHQTTYDYNFATGDIISQTDGEGNTTYYTYDILGRITELEYPDTKTKRAEYDDDNNIVTTYDEKNHYVKQYFDGLGRKIKAETYTNNSLYQTTNSSYNYLGLVSGTTDPLERTTSFTYDALGRMTNSTLPDGNSSSRVYNDIANTLLVTYENGNTKKLFYDDLGRLVKIEEYPESETTYTTNYYYDDLSNLTQKVLHNGYTETYIYDDLGRLTRTNYPDSTYEEITYDNAGNIISTRDRKANVVTYTYDELNRLVRKSNSDSTSVKYTYDKRSLLIKEEANFSAVSGSSAGGGGGRPEFLDDTNAVDTDNDPQNFLSGNLTLLGENKTEDNSLASSSDIAYYDRPYKFFGKLTADKEVISKRTETSKTFDNGDGTYTSVFHAKPIHFKNNLNQWEEIDARIVKTNGKFKAAKNKFDISYGDGNLYSVSKGSSSIGFTPTKIRINDEEISVDNSKINWNLDDEYHLEGKIADGVYLWLQSHEVFVRHAIKTDRPVSDFEAVYLVSDSGYAKVGRIETKDSKNYYLPDENGNIFFNDSDGNSIRIPQPIMWNDENVSISIAHELWEENGKLYYRKYSTEDGNIWLSNQEGTLYLDSSTFYGDIKDGGITKDYDCYWDYWFEKNICNTYYSVSTNAVTNRVGSHYTQSTHNHAYTYRVYLYFDTANIGETAIVTDANLSLYGYKAASSNGNVNIYQGTQADTLTTAHWNSYSGSSLGQQTFATSAEWKVWVGIDSVINKTGLTKMVGLGQEIQGANYYITLYMADYSGTEYDSKLEATYYVPNGAPGKPIITSVDGTIKPPEGNGYNVSDPDGDNMKHRWRVVTESNSTAFDSEWFDSPNDINGTGFTGLTLGNTYNVYLESNDSKLVTLSDPYQFEYTGQLPPKSIITSIGNQQTNNSYATQNPPLGHGFNFSDLDGDNLKHRWRVVTESNSTAFDSGWFDDPNDINATEFTGLSFTNTYKAYLDVNDSVNVVSSVPFVFTLESSQLQFTSSYDTSITYTYDSRGRLTSETSDINGSTYTTSYGYDDASNITSITYPSTNSYSYTYDDVNRITALTGYASFAYTATNMIHTIDYANNITTTYAYDVRDRPTNIAIENLETLNYTYDPSGNVLSMNDWEYEYDGLNRLEAATSVFELDYTYDALGNRTQQTENAVTTSYTYSNMMRLTAKTVAGQATDFTYDSNGNLTEKEEGNSSYTYIWDINNRLREVREDGNLLFEYLYDSQGRRVKSHNHSTGVTTTYIYAGINVIYEETSSESTDYLYANGMRIAKKTGVTAKYFHSDHLGSTRLVTDSSGQPTFESDYKPFGEDANATGTENYAFTGQYSEAEIGLYYFGARWYDASLGRFISEDPIKGSMISSQSQNPYVYCMNNPLRYVDPSGMLVTDDPGSVDGYLQTYYGGEYHYYSAMDGSCNVSGESYTYNQLNPPSTTSEKDNAITGKDVKQKIVWDSQVQIKVTPRSGGGGHAQIPGTTWWKDMDDPYGAYNGHPVDPNLIEVGFELNLLFWSGSIYGVYNPITNEWSDVQGGTAFGFTQVSVIGYAVDTPFKSFADYDAYYENNGHLDIDVVRGLGFKARYFEGHGWEGGVAGGLAPPLPEGMAIAKIVTSISLAGGGSL